ncbi:MAG: hypothetical protein AAF614_18965 [Chloroflexota bacterium]
MRLFVWVVVIVIGGATAVSRLLAHSWWVFDIFNNFHPHYLLILLVALLLFWRWQSWWGVGITAVFTFIPLTLLLPHYLPPTTALAPSVEPPIRLFMSNVYSFRPNLNSVLTLAHESDADIIVLLEMIPFHYNEVQTLRETHPHYFHEPSSTAGRWSSLVTSTARRGRSIFRNLCGRQD